MIEAYPLDWPLDYKRTPASERKKSQFKSTTAAARDFLKAEIKRLKAEDLIISSNLPIKSNGDLYADFGRYKIDDPGVAIYFVWKEKYTLMCCDQYKSVWENIMALAKGIEAIRGMERWGISDFMERAFTGFQALPPSPSTKRPWWIVLGVSKDATEEEVRAAYKIKAKMVHPDKGGSSEQFHELQQAHDEAYNALN